jgi:hypothetical protein
MIVPTNRTRAIVRGLYEGSHAGYLLASSRDGAGLSRSRRPTRTRHRPPPTPVLEPAAGSTGDRRNHPVLPFMACSAPRR